MKLLPDTKKARKPAGLSSFLAHLQMRMYAPNSDRTLTGIAAEFTQSRDHGLAYIEALVREWSVRMTIPEDTIRTYLTSNIFYHLDEECLNGLQTFYTYAAKYDILPH